MGVIAPVLPPDLPITVTTGSDPLVNGDNLQTAINNAVAGDVIVLQSGAHYGTRVAFTNSFGPQGNPFFLPNKSMPVGKTVTITSSRSPSLPTGRLNPSVYAPLLATIETNSDAPCIQINDAAGQYTFRGIEFRNTANVAANNGFITEALVYMQTSGTASYANIAHDMLFDRIWIHPYEDVPTPHSTLRSASIGINMDGARMTLRNSYISGFTGFQSNDPGTSVQSEGIQISYGPGPVTVTNNFVEAFGWNILTGGSGALTIPARTTTASSITSTSATFVSTTNLLVGDYVGFHTGGPIPGGGDGFFARNSDGQLANGYVAVIDSIGGGGAVTYHGVGLDGIDTAIAPQPIPGDGTLVAWRGVNLVDMTVTKNTFSKRAEWWDWVVNNGLNPPKSVWEIKEGSNILFEGNLISLPATPVGQTATATNPCFSLNQWGDSPWAASNNNIWRNNIWRGLGRLVTVQGYAYHSQVPPVGTITFTNNLLDGTSKSAFSETAAPNGNASGWIFTHNTVRGVTNSIMHALSDPTGVTLTFKDNVCTTGGFFFNPITAYPGIVQDHNLLINNSGGSPPGYTSTDTVVADDTAAKFVNVSGADAGGDYHGWALASTSPGHLAASDGKDMGVDFAALDAAMAGNDGWAGV